RRAHGAIEGFLRLAQQVPGAVLGRIAHPGGERAVHPAAGRHPWERCSLQAACEARGECRELDEGMAGEQAVERLEEVVAVERVVLPGDRKSTRLNSSHT